MNRAKPIHAVRYALLSACFLLSAASFSSAQARGGADNRRPSAAVSTGASRATAMPIQKQFYGPKLAAVPRAMTQRVLDPKTKSRFLSRAPGDEAVVRQTTLLTKNDPSLQYSYQQSPCNNQHPYWTSDEKYIYFDSNRNSDTDNTIRTDGLYNIFRMFADGSGLSQIRTSTVNEIEPCVSVDGATVAFVAGGTLTYANGLDNPTSSAFSLYTYNISAGGTPTSLTVNNPSGFVFTDVRHPSFSPGATQIAFQGQLVKGAPYHIFIVDLQTDNITQMTGPAPGNAAAIESNDTCPSWSPDGTLIAFTTNASGLSAVAPMQATGLNAANQTTPGDNNQYDIWVLQPNPFTPDPHQVTNSSSIAGGLKASNKNPAWSSLRADPLGNIPNETNQSGFVTSSANMIAFASTRANTDPANPYTANAIKSTYDIYFMHTKISPDPLQPGSVTVSTPEAAGNMAIKLQTTSPGSTFNPNFPNDPSYNDPTFDFDPNFTSNEDYPAWPQYISSYRIAFQSDRGNTLQIWASTILDLNAPTLLKYDLPNNEIVHVARDSAPNVSVRQVNAGETLRFRVSAVDYETGISSVYIQIKDPNSGPQSADALEHKIYYIGPAFLDTGPLYVLTAPYEEDCQAINPNTYQFRTPGAVSQSYINKVGELEPGHANMPNFWPGWNQYVPGIDDLFAFSGGAHPPDDDVTGDDYSGQGGFWLRLWDDGPIDDPVNPGHEPSGEVKGDGIYTASWTTPSALPSDWLIDVIVRDNAINPFFDPTNPNATTNWKIYDNVWGFTTQQFVGSTGLLYVDDYDSGQKFFQTNVGAFTNTGSRLGAAAGSFNSAQPGSPGTFFNGVPTESWMTEHDGPLTPTTAVQGTSVFALANYLTTLGLNAYQDALTQEPGGVNPVPVTARYDIWRIQCRGPVPDVILNAYKGHIETIPKDVLNGGKNASPTQVFVAERCVIWHAPYAGDLFVGPGTILDSDTQVRLANYVQTGGRLLLNGTDCAWGLTLGGGQASPLLSNTFKVNYAGDVGGVTIKPNLTDPPAVAPYVAPLSNMGRGTHPIVMETFYNATHAYPGTTTPDDPPGTAMMYLQTPATGTPLREWGAPNGITGDEITMIGASTLDTEDFDASYNETGAQNLVWVTNTATPPIVSKTVFVSFDFSSLNPEYYTVGTTKVLKNRRAEMIHNAGDYLRTGRIVGVIRDLTTNAALKGVFLRALSQHKLNPDGTPFVYTTTLSLADGSYVLDGLDPTGGYDIQVFDSGYATTHGQAGLFHGGYQTTVDFFLSKVRPGTIAGTVTISGSNPVTPAPGLIIVATDLGANGQNYTATTATDGTYSIPNVPASTYSVTIPNSPTGNLDKLGYGSCIPSSYGLPPAPKPAVIVTGNSTTGGVDFAVTQSPGSITGIVESHTPNGNPNNIIPGATVTIVGTNTTAVTDSTGHYTLANLVPATYTIQATASGYRPSQQVNVTVTTKATVEQDFVDNPNFPTDPTKQLALVKAQPGGISGLVSTSLGIPVTGATIVVTDAGGNTLVTTTSFAPPKTNGNNTFNYDTGMIVPAGAVVTVTASKTGYNPVTPPANPDTNVAVAEATETTGINFFLDPLHIFNTLMSLVSAPYDYSSVDNGDVAALLGIPAGDVTNGDFQFITWVPSTGVYAYYPKLSQLNPAQPNTFKLGEGYFMQETDTSVNLALATLGTPATPNTIYNVPLKVGWNLIGDPWSFPINFLNLKVICADGTEEDVETAETGTNPTLGAALWGFDNNQYEVSYTLDPWKGYWIRVFDNRPAGSQTTPATITLLVDPAAQQNRGASAPADARFAMTNGNTRAGGWKLNITASAGATNSAPSIVGVIPGATSTYDQYKLEAPPAIGPNGVSMAVIHTDWNQKSGRYAVDLRPPGAASNSWNFTVTSTVPKQSVTVAWPAVAAVSGKQDLLLTDTDTNTSVDLRTHPSYTIPAGPTGVTRHFTITASPAKRISLQIANVNAHMAGSRGAGTGPMAVDVGYTLTANATTQVNILKHGHIVRHLENGVTREAGDASLVWDMKNDQGVSSPADTYVIEVRAQDALGHMARQITPLVIVR